jgi:molybdopterin-guanine dinucleotide biosynthesis protein A
LRDVGFRKSKDFSIMDQAQNAGHHAITREAVRELFAKRAQDGKINGMDEETYFQQLDQGQAYADRTPIDFHEEGVNHRSLSESMSDLGDTWKPYWAAPDGQRNHAMADPSLSGEENLEAIQNYTVSQLEEARQAGTAGDPSLEMRHLGQAAHTMEDSYSDAHTRRDAEGNIEQIHTFDPTNLSYDGGIVEGTHHAAEDEVPTTAGKRFGEESYLARTSDQQAADRVEQMLESYVDHHTESSDQADSAFAQAVAPAYQESNTGVSVDVAPDGVLSTVAKGIYQGGSAVVTAGEEAYDFAASTYNQAADAASAAYDTASSAVSSAVDTVEDTASSAYDSASSAVSSAVDTVEDTASQAYKAVTDLF